MMSVISVTIDMKKRKKILIVNDDGISAHGIRVLAETAMKFGDVWIVAPVDQCSGMSHRILIYSQMAITELDFGLQGIKAAYALDGTPANCVKVAVNCILNEKPDVVLSGINFGYNSGFDIAYSGTIGAAREALINGIPAISFSTQDNGVEEVMHGYLESIMNEVLETKTEKDELINVNFPGCKIAELNGVLRDRVPARRQYYCPVFKSEVLEDGKKTISIEGVGVKAGSIEDGTDISALVNDYISIGFVKLGL